MTNQTLLKVFFAGFASGAFLLILAGDNVQSKEELGKTLFVRRCSGCHAADVNKEGPRLRGVYGRTAAGIVGFDYSEALKKSGLRWNDSTLDQWLSDPDALVPDTDMAFRLANRDERQAVIAYLKSLRTP